MLAIRSSAAMAHVLAGPLDPLLNQLLQQRRAQLEAYDGYDLGELAHFLIVQPGDRLNAIEGELGFSLLANFIDGARFPDPAFTPSWEWIEDHGGWFELTFILSDDGFGWSLLIQDAEGVEPGLLDLCRQYAD